MKTPKTMIGVFVLIIAALSFSSFKAQTLEKKVQHYENGQIESETFYNANNEPSGIWKFYHENGQLKQVGEVTEGTFGKPVLQIGEWVAYHANGKLSAKGNYDYGNKSDVWTYYHDNGQISSTGVHGGEGYASLFEAEDGLWKYYYPNGNLQKTGSFEDGERSGEWKFYHENGVIMAIAHYVLDNSDKSVSHGELQYYNEKGALEKVQVWEMGTLISSEEK